MLKKKIHNFINNNSIFLKFIYGLIIVNVLSIILVSYEEIEANYGQLLAYFEIFSVIIFSIEYLIRLWTADLEYKKGTAFSKRLKFSRSTFGLIDLLAVLPILLAINYPIRFKSIKNFKVI